jgi:hypothetical protein
MGYAKLDINMQCRFCSDCNRSELPLKKNWPESLEHLRVAKMCSICVEDLRGLSATPSRSKSMLHLAYT